MKNHCQMLFCAILFFSSGALSAQINGDENVLAAQGDAVITHEQFGAAVDRLPADRRFQTVRTRSRFEDMLDRMMLSNQLSTDAREAGFNLEPIVLARMKLAAEEELAKAWMDHYLEQIDDADYEAMARERYQLNRDRYMTPETIDVTHILVDRKTRSKGEALELALELEARVNASPDDFEALVMQYSDDPSKAGNKGSFKGVKRGDMVPAFEKRAFELAPGEVSEPVETPYGFHVIRLDAIHPPAPIPFEQVRVGLEREMKKRHLDRARDTYLMEVSTGELLITQESIENMVEQVFGKDVLAKYAEERDSQ